MISCHAHYGPAWLQRGHGDVVGIGQLDMSRKGDCPLVELEYMVLSSVKHTPDIDVTANSRRESFVATSATKPLTYLWGAQAYSLCTAIGFHAQPVSKLAVDAQPSFQRNN